MTTRRASDRDPELDKPAAPEPKADTRVKPDPLASGHPGEYVRVRSSQSGDHYTTTRVLARKAGATLIPNHEAVDAYGKPLPRKRNTKES